MADYMEDRLDLPLSTVLPLIQQGVMNHTEYFGVRTFKSPMDAWIYQEIIYETRPDVIVEIGTARGGSTLLLAHLCDLLDHGRVIGLDLSHGNVPRHVKAHPRISLVEGDACENFGLIENSISPREKVMVIEDSSHTFDNTLNVLRLYSGLIKPGDYLIVEDSVGQHGLPSGRIPGPYEAIETFVGENPLFEIDRSREHFFITFNPKGYLKRIAGAPEQPPPASSVRSFRGFSLLQLRLREGVRLLVPPIVILLLEKLNNRRLMSTDRSG